MAYDGDELAAVENALRELVECAGLDNLGVRNEDKKKWRERREKDLSERGAGFPEDRLIYYSDLDDLRRLILKDANWPLFERALLNKAEIGVFFDLIRRFRNPHAHNRELSTHEQHLAAGISGEIRTRIVRYLSTMDTPDSYFPRIVSFQDNLGTKIGSQPVLRVGDEMEFVLEAADPLGADLEYEFMVSRPGFAGPSQAWSASNRFSFRVAESHISKYLVVAVSVRSPRQHHAQGDVDATANFNYVVIPRRDQ